jgi:hypothetical protein
MPDSAGNCRLPAKQERVALLLATGSTQAEAARQTKVGERTIRSWLHSKPEFGKRISQIRDELTSAALGRLLDGQQAAALKLHALVLHGEKESVQLRAAVALLTLAQQLRQTLELETILAALEAKGGKKK